MADGALRTVPQQGTLGTDGPKPTAKPQIGDIPMVHHHSGHSEGTGVRGEEGIGPFGLSPGRDPNEAHGVSDHVVAICQDRGSEGFHASGPTTLGARFMADDPARADQEHGTIVAGKHRKHPAARILHR